MTREKEAGGWASPAMATLPPPLLLTTMVGQVRPIRSSNQAQNIDMRSQEHGYNTADWSAKSYTAPVQWQPFDVLRPIPCPAASSLPRMPLSAYCNLSKTHNPGGIQLNKAQSRWHAPLALLYPPPAEPGTPLDPHTHTCTQPTSSGVAADHHPAAAQVRGQGGKKPARQTAGHTQTERATPRLGLGHHPAAAQGVRGQGGKQSARKTGTQRR